MRRLLAWMLVAVIGAGLLAVIVNARPSDKPFAAPLELPAKGLTDSQRELAAEREAGSGDLTAAALSPSLTLEREEARPALSALAAPGLPAPLPDPDTLPRRWRVVHHAVATAAGIFEADGMTLVLPGIDVVASSETCAAPGGQTWPCGMAARTAFRAYMRGRSMNCHLPDRAAESTILAECLLQGEDPAQWLVRNGWARVKTDSSYSAQNQQAQALNAGIYGAMQK